MWAAEKGCTAEVLLLVTRGADVHRRSAAGETAILLAARSGHAAAVPALARAGADLASTDGNGRSPLLLAAAANTTCTVQALVQAGAPLHSLPPQWVHTVAYMLSQRCQVRDGGGAPAGVGATATGLPLLPASGAHPCHLPPSTCLPQALEGWGATAQQPLAM